MKKTIVTLLTFLCITGCSEVAEKNLDSAYVSGEEEVAFVKEKNVYTCENDEFFYIERQSASSVNFIYGNYSTPLAQRPSTKTKLFSDGVYNLFLNNDIAKVAMGNEVVLEDCKKHEA